MEMTASVNTTDGRKVTVSGHPDDVDYIVAIMQIIGPCVDLEWLEDLLLFGNKMQAAMAQK